MGDEWEADWYYVWMPDGFYFMAQSDFDRVNAYWTVRGHGPMREYDNPPGRPFYGPQGMVRREPSVVTA
jgi:hypothetical protein